MALRRCPARLGLLVLLCGLCAVDRTAALRHDLSGRRTPGGVLVDASGAPDGSLSAAAGVAEDWKPKAKKHRKEEAEEEGEEEEKEEKEEEKDEKEEKEEKEEKDKDGEDGEDDKDEREDGDEKEDGKESEGCEVEDCLDIPEDVSAADAVNVGGDEAADEGEGDAKEKKRRTGLFQHKLNLFEGGDKKHHTYRIPSIVSTGGDRLIAFAEGRAKWSKDYGDINLVYKLSDDGGATWTSMRYISGTNDGTFDTWGNPTVLYERPWDGASKGRVHVYMMYNEGDLKQKGHKPLHHGDRLVFHVYSDNWGKSWSVRRNRTDALQPETFKWDATGPGTGIQKQLPPNRSMLVVPAIKRNFISTDHGLSWTSVPITTNEPPPLSSEATVSECADGSLFRNDRPIGSNRARQTLYLARPDRPSDKPVTLAEELPDPRCEGSSLTWKPGKLIFLNSASERFRTKLRLYASADCGKTWQVKRWLYKHLYPEKHDRPVARGGYTSMAKLEDGRVAVLLETDIVDKSHSKHGHRSIDFLTFDLDWLCEGAAFCFGKSCEVEALSDDDHHFRVAKSCVEEATGHGSPPDTVDVQLRRDGELLDSGPVAMQSANNGFYQGQWAAKKSPAVFKKGDVLLFPERDG